MVEDEKPKPIRFKVIKQSTEKNPVYVDVDVGSVVYERMVKEGPTVYQPQTPIPKEADKPPIIDADAENAATAAKKKK